jgi:hypothetical protein
MDTTNRMSPDARSEPSSNPWVEARLRALDPPAAWEPAAGVALAQFRARVEAAPVRRPLTRAWGWMLAASAACVLLLMLPGTRTAAQRLWDIVWTQRVAVVQIDVDRLPSSLTESQIRIDGAHKTVASVAEAASYVGFAPRLPDASAVPGEPVLQVMGAVSLVHKVNAADLEGAARTAGLSDLQIPAAWDGVRFGLHTSKLVAAEYPDMQLLQSLPLAITTPPGFDLGPFIEALLRIGGMSPAEARTFSAQMAATPVWLLPVSPEDRVSMRQVRLDAGPATLVHEPSEDGNPGRTTLLWTVPDRIYVLSASDRYGDDQVIAVANAIR